MEIKEIKMDLFEVESPYHLAHCISSDCKLGAGIAVEFERRYQLRQKLLSYSSSARQCPTCIQIDRVFNLITKELYYHKPTYETVQASLEALRDRMMSQEIKRVAMPRIASGLDRLNWARIKKIIMEVFKDTDIEILICYQ